MPGAGDAAARGIVGFGEGDRTLREREQLTEILQAVDVLDPCRAIAQLPVRCLNGFYWEPQSSFPGPHLPILQSAPLQQ
jgi:hypothetical protein